VLRWDDYIEPASGADELAAPLQTLRSIEECTPTEADLLLSFIRRKYSPPYSKQA
jgi:hypothetical protein